MDGDIDNFIRAYLLAKWKTNWNESKKTYKK